MTNISCIVVDDEPAARSLLKGYIDQLEYLECVGDFSKAMDAFHFLQQQRVSLIFLDIPMPQLNGFELARIVSPQQAIIFITAFSDYALQGFDTGAIDYLVKPVSFERFLRAVTKAMRYLNIETPVASPAAKASGFTVKVNGQTHTLPTDDILYIQSFGNFLKIFHTGKMTLATDTIKRTEELLKPQGFVRCHRSYLVNAAHVKQVRPDTIVLSNETQLPIGYLYKREVESSLS